MPNTDTLRPYKDLIEAGFPPENVIAELNKHIAALQNLPEGVEAYHARPPLL